MTYIRQRPVPSGRSTIELLAFFGRLGAFGGLSDVVVRGAVPVLGARRSSRAVPCGFRCGRGADRSANSWSRPADDLGGVVRPAQPDRVQESDPDASRPGTSTGKRMGSGRSPVLRESTSRSVENGRSRCPGESPQDG